MDARQLVAIYQQNEVKADQNFKGKTFYVTGTVDNIKNDMFDKIYITLVGEEVLSTAWCYLDDEKAAAELNPGQHVTIKGTCKGYSVLQVNMKDCSLIH